MLLFSVVFKVSVSKYNMLYSFFNFIKNAVPLRLEKESLNFYQICSYCMNVDYFHLQGKLE